MNSLLDGCRVRSSSDVSPTVIVIVQTVADLTLLDTFGSSGASPILRTSDLCIHVVNYTCIYKGIQLKPIMHHTGSWLEAASPPRRLCYRPTVFSRHLPIIKLSHREESFGVSLKDVIISGIFISKICERLKWRNLKWRQSMAVCSNIGLCLFFNDLSLHKMDAMTDEWTNTSPVKTKVLEEPVYLLHSPILILRSYLWLNCVVT
jgi:hypothetical protein